MDKITYHELVDEIAKEAGETHQLTDSFVKEMVSVINEGLERDGRVRVAKFGIFELRRMAKTEGVDPQTGESITIPEHTRVAFKPGRSLRRKVNRRYRRLSPIRLSRSERTSSDKTSHAAIGDMRAENSRRTRKTAPGIIAAILLIAFAVVLFFLTNPLGIKPGLFESENQDLQNLAAKPPVSAEQDITDNTVAKKVKPQAPVTSPESSERIHTVASGDRLWDLAISYYDQAYFWPNIYRGNSDKISNPDLIIAGTDISIPPLQGDPHNLTSTDSSNIAAGYFQAYKAYRVRPVSHAKYYLWVAERFDNGIIAEHKDEVKSSDLAFVTRRD